MKRIKRRYLALQIDSDCIHAQKDLMDTVWGAVTQIYGEYGASLTNLVLINYDEKEKIAVLRTNLAALDSVRIALTSITSVTGKVAAVHILAISGTIKALCSRIKF